MSKLQQLDSMPNLKFQAFLDKNHSSNKAFFSQKFTAQVHTCLISQQFVVSPRVIQFPHSCFCTAIRYVLPPFLFPCVFNTNGRLVMLWILSVYISLYQHQRWSRDFTALILYSVFKIHYAAKALRCNFRVHYGLFLWRIRAEAFFVAKICTLCQLTTLVHCDGWNCWKRSIRQDLIQHSEWCLSSNHRPR